METDVWGRMRVAVAEHKSNIFTSRNGVSNCKLYGNIRLTWLLLRTYKNMNKNFNSR